MSDAFENLLAISWIAANMIRRQRHYFPWCALHTLQGGKRLAEMQNRCRKHQSYFLGNRLSPNTYLQTIKTSGRRPPLSRLTERVCHRQPRHQGKQKNTQERLRTHMRSRSHLLLRLLLLHNKLVIHNAQRQRIAADKFPV